MAKWKYAKPKTKPKEYPYVYLPLDEEQELLLVDWVFEKNAYNDSLFKTHVEEWNGNKVDKIWSVWDFELKETLKKLLKGKKPNKHKVKIKITKHEEDMEESYDVSIVS
ncbi:MAG: hypothetical protein U9R08_03970 [Nanoarchaeota archaeon]|nr:hypothetical protein [Nanoarchaeota archaeon]